MEPSGTRNFPVRPLIIGIGIPVLLCALLGTKLLWARSADGPVITSIHLRTSPWSAALDERTGQLYVVNRAYGGFSYVPASTGATNYFGYSSSLAGTRYGSSTIQSQNTNTVSVISAAGNYVEQTVPVGEDPRAAAIDPVHGRVYVTSDDQSSVSVIDEHDTANSRTVRVGIRPHAVTVSGPTNRAFVVNTSDGTVSVMDASSSRVLRVVHVPAAVDTAGAAVDGATSRVFVAGGGSMSVLDARSGAVLKTAYLQSADQLQRSALAQGGATYGQARFGYSAVMTQVVVDQKAGRVYILEPGLLSVVDAGSSAVLRNIPVSMDATALALDPRNGHLFMARAGDSAGSSGSLDVLDPQTGRTLRTFTVGVAPTALVVDQHIGRLYVVDRGGEQKVANPLNWLPDGVRQHLPLGSNAQSTTRMLPGSIFVLSLDKI